ncbi:tripeptidyl-peptidase II [Malassezia vespertilionis]|uniref:tripeptidyl-peptidase II n=1 Tax=Malassezia vespertilionis TaxID=2020962 RepID=A0A2N1JE56_9BASI|nr:tripeptidyl-peptidase II [Malassezia vespertilionis]PKI84840.1 hypothetical protein MVES_001052 [Malassezia vespertilionis]WFD05783.1 tripeptidyl-peptidase II [Malassezia vespertilionis]
MRTLAVASLKRANPFLHSKALFSVPRMPISTSHAREAGEPAFPVEGLLPKQATMAESFLQRFPKYNGRGVRVAVLDTGVDPAALGLDGPNKVVDVIDCTGGGDVPLRVVEAQASSYDDAFEVVSPETGRKLLVSRNWSNPSGVWNVGTKRAYDFWPSELVQRRTAQRKQAFDVSHAALLQAARQNLTEAEQDKTAEVSAQRKEEARAQIEVLQALQKSWHDPGPVIEAVVFHDGSNWRAAVGGAEGDVHDPSAGEPVAQRANIVDLRASPCLTDFRTEREWASFGTMDLLTYTVNILDDGKLLSLVTLSGTHGTHVAGIIGAKTEEEATNGVAPGAEIVSLKIGDARLGSMEQGQALLRAVQALVDTQCDVANMSFGEDGGFGVENKGAFVDALKRVIHERGLLYVSSAGNNGPALTTVGQPGGTTSDVLSVGAYVNAGAMQRAEYALIDDDVRSSPTTWSSRGPTADGADGVSIYAPGAAITSICKYALQSKQLMNGTSMSSPNAAGAVALLVSGLKDQGIPVTPWRVYRAIQETAQDVADPLGVRFIDVDKAWDYLMEHRDDAYADARFDVHITPAGKPLNGSADMRGIYLREAAETQRVNQCTVHVAPKFKEADTERAFHLEIRAALKASEPWIHVPTFLALGCNGRSFEVRVAANELPPGLHSARISAYDTNDQRTKLFDIPVTVAKPVIAGPTYQFPHVRLASGQMQRQFVQVPHGATWAQIRLRSTRHEITGTSVRFWLHLVQLEPQKRLSKVEDAFIMALNENEPVAKKIQVRGGMTLEVCAAEFWSSKAGFDLDMEMEFHGLQVGPSSTESGVALLGGSGMGRVEVASMLRVEECKPQAVLEKRRSFVRPSKADIRPLLAPRDKLPSGHQLNELVLMYPLSFKETTTFTYSLPVSGNLYDNSISLLVQIVDRNNAEVHFGDIYPKEVTLLRGDYTVRVQALHSFSAVLEKRRNMVFQMDEALVKPKEVVLNMYRDQVDLFGSVDDGKLDMFKLLPGERRVLCIDTNLEGENLPASAPGDVLLGSLRFGGHDKVPLQLVVPPPPVKAKEDAPSDPPQLPELLADVAKKLQGDDRQAFLDAVTAQHPDSLDILEARLEAIAVDAVEDAENAIGAADAILAQIDQDKLLLWLGAKQPPALEQTAEQKRVSKQFHAQKKALELALTRKATAQLLRGDTEAFQETLLQSRKYMPDTGKDSKAQALHSNLVIAWHENNGRYAQALRAVRKLIEELGHGTDETLAELKKARALERSLLEKLGWDVWAAYAQRWSWLQEHAAPAPF